MRLFATSLTIAFLAVLVAATNQTWPDWWWSIRKPSPEIVFDRRLQPFIEKSCLECHDEAARKGDFSLEHLPLPGPHSKGREAWERVLTHVSGEIMPPPDASQPTSASREQFIYWLDQTLHPIDPHRPDPGQVVIRRLNRQAYRNTVQDLFDIDFNPAENFPEDDSSHGFDNIASVLSLSPLLLERYLTAAEEITTQVLPDPQPPPRIYSGAPENWTGGDDPNGASLYSTGGTLSWQVDLPVAGRYQLQLLVAQNQAGDEPARFALRIDGKTIRELPANGSRRKPRTHDLELDLPAGTSRLEIKFLNDFYVAATADSKSQDRNFFLNNATLVGPHPIPGQSNASLPLPDWIPARLANENLRAWFARALTPIVRRAYRRPPLPDEISRLSSLAADSVEAGDSSEAALQVALQAILTSPNFLFIFDSADNKPRPAKQGIQPLSDYALAARLSYFLWNGPPDERLLDLADQNKIRSNLTTETTRLLADPRAQRFVESFAGQWLEVRNLPLRNPDPSLFPDWSPSLANSMQQETLRFFGDFLRNQQPIDALLTSDFTFVDARLARFYGLPAPADGDRFERVIVNPDRRAGVLGQAGVLTVTSYPNRTSPVLRGKFILEKILGTPPPPPPPNIPSLAEHGTDGQSQTLRQRLELHRASPACATCHDRIDPLGFALENYDALGRRRETEDGHPIDSSGRLVTGEPIDSVVSLATVLADGHRDEFHRNFAHTLLTYALGRGLDYYDRPTVEKIVSSAARQGHTLPAYIDAVVASIAFQNQRAEAPDITTPPDRVALAPNH